jgi:hypothetical protein
VESCEDYKTRETEAKSNNNMLQLLLVGGIVYFSSPGSFTEPRIAKIYSSNDEHSPSAHFGQIHLNGQHAHDCFHKNPQGHGQEA